jgi:Flp pilus assembly pilin Flp
MFSKISSRIVAAQTARKEGQAMVEYGLILALVSVAAVATLTPLGTAIATLFTTVTGSI